MSDDWNDRDDPGARSDPGGTPSDGGSGAFHDGPEPPFRWNPGDSSDGDEASETQPQQPQLTGTALIGSTRFEIRNDEVGEFEGARRYMTAAQIIAVLSLFLGGVLLSSLALVCALAANAKLSNLAAAPGRSAEAQRALKRAGVMTIAVAGIALLLNIAAIAFLYPYVAEVMQSGSLDSLIAAPQPNATGNTTWG